MNQHPSWESVLNRPLQYVARHERKKIFFLRNDENQMRRNQHCNDVLFYMCGWETKDKQRTNDGQKDRLNRYSVFVGLKRERDVDWIYPGHIGITCEGAMLLPSAFLLKFDLGMTRLK